ncbi:MAG: hypothetical protein JXQ75_02160 [Phycisphaerae bacterium]|nr:hypothetical protein [Phycisphaerae bacterium]
MAERPGPAGQTQSDNGVSPELFEPLRERFLDMEEAERHRLLGSLLVHLAEWNRTVAGGRAGEGAGGAESLGKRISALGEENAGLKDALAQAQADLAHHTKQLEAEQGRGQELQKIITEQRARLESLTNKVNELEAELVAKNSELHQAEVATDDLRLRLQRADLAAGDTSQVERLEAAKRELAAQGEALRGEVEQVRADKDAEIERLNAALLAARKQAGHGGDATLAKLWERLASAQPALVEGHILPTVQAAERFFDAFIELANFVHSFELDVRPFLERYTKYNETVKRPWDAYQRYGRIHDTIRSTITVKGGKPVGVLKMRLHGLKSWAIAAMIAGDSAIECVGSELQDHLLGPAGAGSDPNCRVRDYAKRDGHMIFGEHIRELRSQKLSEAYGLGS